MHFDEYLTRAMDTAVYPEHGTGSKLAVAYASLGLAGEAGELANKVKKLLRGDFDSQDDWMRRRDGIKKELGGVLWYVAAVAREFGFSLDITAMDNLDELALRKERGTIKGDGDDR